MIRIPVHHIPKMSNKAKGRAQAEIVGYALVDDDCAELGNEYWTKHTGYAKTYRNGEMVFMHHAVIGRSVGLDVSHKNADKFDNRRANLAHATRSTNMLNIADGATVGNASCGIRGVTRDDRSRPLAKPWRGKVSVGGRGYQTRRYATAEEAGQALEALRESLRVGVGE